MRAFELEGEKFPWFQKWGALANCEMLSSINKPVHARKG